MTGTAGYTYHFERLGFDAKVQSAFKKVAQDIEGAYLARIVRLDRGLPLAASADETCRVQSANHLLKEAKTSAQARVAIGDWVVLSHPEGHEMPVIERILPRESAFVRKDPAETSTEQVVMANVDVVFVLHALTGGEINVARLERELVGIYESGATPVIVLTKSDLIEDNDYIEAQRALAKSVGGGAEVIVESALTDRGVAKIKAHLAPGTTGAMIGASGVGKSTLTNRLVGHEVQETGMVRAFDDKGRHTTVARAMVEVPDGGVLIDMPGTRAMGLWHAYRGLALTFSEITEAAANCKFSDCTHSGEPGCAVVGNETVSPQRLERYQSLRAELEKVDKSNEEQRWAKGEGKSRSFIKNSKKRLGQ